MPDPHRSRMRAKGPVHDRVHVIDALRAIALYGVITFNLVGMVAALIGGEVMARATPLDLAFATFDLIVIEGKARACFALLFGVGFGLLMDRAAARGQAFTGFYLRRMAVLLAIGLGNLAFLFFGDILILYALLGMVMLLFRSWDDRRVLTLGLALILVPPLIIGGIEAATGAPMPNLAGLSPEQVDALMPASAPVYHHGGYLDVVQANLRYYVDHYRAETGYVVMYDLGVLGLFLLGLWTARNGVFADVERWRPLLRRIAWWCVPVGLALSVLHGSRRMGLAAEGWVYGLVTAAYAGLAIAALGYIALLCLLLGRSPRLRAALAPIGRMALTGYLASNAIGGFVWYGWGLGQMGRWNVAAINLFALALFAALWLFSAAWLRAFRFGPAEWLWRSLTYGRAQPMRRGSRG